VTGALRVALIDYGAGNLHSVAKACAQVGLAAELVAEPEGLGHADAVVLPGVGAFPEAMRRLAARGLVEALRDWCVAGRPFLGICLGLQVLFAYGEEGEGSPGLGVFPGRVRRLAAPGLKVPHMGWNELRYRAASPLFAGVPEGSHVYFVHSYHAVPEDPGLVTAWVEYGEEVTAAVGRGAVQAVQFHPEKSGRVGLRILANFARLVAAGGRP
jgi:glutamine amidotransferase